MLVLVRALVLARSLGASEIGIDHLLAALDPESGPDAPPEGAFFPVPRQDMALSRDAAAAVNGPTRSPQTLPSGVKRSERT
jgi:hypothetical protein